MNLAQDRIQQGRFFLRQAEDSYESDRNGFRYLLEASIVSARSVTFLLQKQYHDTPGFDEWYSDIQKELSADPLARFLLEQRNFVLKQGITQIQKAVHITAYITTHAGYSFQIHTIRASLSNRLRHLLQDVRHYLKEGWVRLRRSQRTTPRNKEKPAQVSAHFYFEDKEWNATPAIELLHRQFDKLESIVNDADRQFDHPVIGTESAQ
jgi:hypothetical protein